jgi:SM-20-related protein
MASKSTLSSLSPLSPQPQPHRNHQATLTSSSNLRIDCKMRKQIFATSTLWCSFTAASAFVTPSTSGLHATSTHRKPTHQLNVATQLMPQISQKDIDVLSTKGFVIVPDFLPQEMVDELRDDILKLRTGSAFREAKIGQDNTNNLNKSIRIAETCFIGRNRPELTRITGDNSVRDRSSGLYDILDGLCDSLVDLCWKESEAKLDKSLTELLYAYYPTGGFYRRHRDAIPNSASVLRKYSLLLYLNRDGWDPERDAGQLRIHLDGGGDELPEGATPNYIDVDPLGGTLVLFKSELVPHEVLDTNSERFALVGWYNRAVTASDIGNLGDGGGGDMVRVGMLGVALALVTFGVASIIGQ